MSGKLQVGLSLDGMGADAASGADGIAALVAAATRAEALGFDFVSLDDPLERPEGGGFRISAVDALAYLARRTTRLGLIAAAHSHYAEPFHTAKEIATLDFISGGRAGLVVDPSRSPAADRFYPEVDRVDDSADRAAQAREFAEVVGELWDSWEDGAEIREVATGRYVDSAKVHHIDHHGRFFHVKGPLITPRPPQGQPPLFIRPDARFRHAAVSTASEATTAIGLAQASSATVLLQLDIPAERLEAVLTELEAAGPVGHLPGAGASEVLTFSQRLGIPRRPSRFA